jgi:uncharacterized repeat protein (TIGR01451 family)
MRADNGMRQSHSAMPRPFAGQRAMKRLSVRLSIVAAVIAIGGTTIAYNIWWKGDTQDQDKAGKTAQKKGEDADKKVKPIPLPEDSAVKPPARSMFDGGGTHRTVSHEEGVDSPASGLSIPPDPTYGSGTMPPEPAVLPTIGSDNASPVGTSGGGFPVRDGSFPTPPPSPTFGGSPTGNLGNPPPVVSLGDDDSPASDIPKPPTQISIGDEVPEALPPGDAPPPPDTSLTGTGSAVGDTPTGDTGGFPTGIAEKPAVGGGLPTGAVAGGAAGAVAGGAFGLGQARNGGSLDDDPPSPATDPLPPLGGSAPEARSGLPTQPPTGLAGTPTALDPSNSPIGSGTPRSSDAFGQENPYARTGVAPTAMGGGLGTQPSVYGDATAVAATAQASNTPGDRQLEGQQMPALAVEKTAPVEVQVDQPASFEIHIRNTGSVPAHQVMVVDQVPRGTEFVDSTPRCTRGTDGTLIWQVGTIEPGDQVTITTKLLPKVED